MDSFSFPESETALSEMTRKCLKIDDKTTSGEPLSVLTAKYNKLRKNLYNKSGSDHSKSTFEDSKIFNVDDISVQPAQSRHMSWSDDDSSDSECPGLSLTALAAKHSKNSSNKQSTSNFVESTNNPQGRLESLSQEELSDSEPPVSLVALAANHSFGNISQSDDKLVEIAAKEIVNKKQDEKMNFISELSSDSDSDEPCSLSALALKHATKALHQESRAAEEDVNLKPRDLLRVANFGRQHTKSESDQFTTAAQIRGQTLANKDLQSETSTSLGSLKEGSSYSRDFIFSLGCSIPNSSRSRNVSLTSSLGCVRDSGANMMSSFSDPDISLNPKSSMSHHNNQLFTDKREVGLTREQTFPDIDDVVFEGINLSSAIKRSSSTSTGAEEVSEMEHEPIDDDGIVTLLDNLDVDSGNVGDETGTKKNSLATDVKDDCSMDASNILVAKVKLRTRKCSSLGRVVCKQWRRVQMPCVRKELLRTSVVAFAFNTPSPDDIIASFLERRQNSSLHD